jgi:hypothetical protein
MDFRATKDDFERENDEAERLVRPAPKIKPPRHDRQREDMHPERDPDTDADPDVSRDPDLSLNYKNVGGSASRVLARFLKADEPSDRVRVRKKDTGNIVYISEKTLKERGGEYETITDEEPKAEEPKVEEPKAEPEAEEPKAPQPKADLAEVGRQLLDEAESDPALKSLLKNLADPESEIGGIAKASPKYPAKPFFKDRELPAGVETLGDLQQALTKAKKPETKPKGKPAPEAKPKKPAPERAEAPDPVVERLDKLISVMERFMAQAPAEARPAIKKEIAEAKKTVEEQKKEPPAAEPPAAEPPKEEAPAAEPPKEEAPKEEAPKEEAPKEEAPAEPKKPAPKKDKIPAPPEKAKAPPKETPDQKAEREDAEASEQAKAVVDKFKKKLHADPAEGTKLKKYLKNLPTTQEVEGDIGFYNEKTRDFAPFEKLPPAQQQEIIEDYERTSESDKVLESVADSVKDNPEAKEAISQLLDPRSDLSGRLRKLKTEGLDLKKLPIAKHIPEMAGVKLPEGIKTIGDLQKFVQAKPELFTEKEEFAAWEDDGGSKSPAFKKWAEQDSRITVGKDGSMLFPLPWGKKRVPWNKLPEEAKKEFYEDFQKHGKEQEHETFVKQIAGADPELAKVLRSLSNPRSDILRGLIGLDLKTTDVVKAIPELQGVKLPPDMTVLDLIAASKKAYPPLPEPERRPVSEDELDAAKGALNRNFMGTGLAVRVSLLDLHPDDVKDIVTQFHQLKAPKIKPNDIESTVEKARAFYVTDPAEIPYPTQGRNAKGQIRKWDDLTPEEQADTYAGHRNTVLAASFALHERVMQSLMARSQIPENLARTMASSMLSKKQGTPDEQADKARAVAQGIFDSVMKSGQEQDPLGDRVVQETLERTKHDPASQRAAVAYFQARDYLDARDKFLSSDSPDQIDERDPPQRLAAKLLKAMHFLQGKQKEYPEEYRGALDPVAKFRNRVMDRMRILAPEKAAEIEPQMMQIEAQEWDEKKRVFDDLKAKREKARRKYQKAYDKAEAEFNADLGHPYRGDMQRHVMSIEDRLKTQGIHLPPEPDPLPSKPIGYDEAQKGPAGLRGMGKKLWDKLLRRKAASAERVAARFLAYSTCEDEETMGKPSSLPKSASTRTSVYWGVEPYPAGKIPGLYPRWEQAHARDLNEADFQGILTAAEQWLKSSVLSTSIEGIVPDTQFRAALDLAIRDHADGKYSVGLHPTLYNRLLARLAGQPETETLLTVREASSGSLYAQATGEERPMSASARIRKYASTIAESNPGIAFDLTNLAFKLAEEEQEEQTQGQQQVQAAAKRAGEVPEAFKEHMKEKKEEGQGQEEQQKQASYKTLKAAVIKAAQSNPNQRAAFMPVLQTIKQLG